MHAVEECPRRWALQRANWEVYDGRAFPSRPSAAAIEGQAVHMSTERVVKALQNAGVESVRSPEASDVLRGLGGLSSVVREAIVEALSGATKNPRFTSLAYEINRKVNAAHGTIRETVQSVLSGLPTVPKQHRAAWSSSSSTGGRSRDESGYGAPNARTPIQNGAYTEVSLYSENPPLYGRGDIIIRTGEEIHFIDIKSGQVSDTHEDQIRLYGLMWLRDSERNPSQKPVTALTLQYGVRRVPVDPPESWAGYGEEVRNRVAGLSEAIKTAPPPARPTRDRCRYCDVRAVCDAFKASPDLWSDTKTVFIDAVVEIISVQDPAALDAMMVVGKNALRSVRIKSGVRWELQVGRRYVILGARYVENSGEGGGPPLLVPSASTEVFEEFL